MRLLLSYFAIPPLPLKSMLSEITPNTSMMVSQSHSRNDSRGGRNNTKGRGQHPQCTYSHRFGHTCNGCYQLHGQLPHTAHLAQSFDHSASLSFVSGSSPTPHSVILTPGKYEYLCLTQAVKSSSIASVAQISNVSTYLTHSSALWILDTRASNYIYGNKDLFFFSYLYVSFTHYYLNYWFSNHS